MNEQNQNRKISPALLSFNNCHKRLNCFIIFHAKTDKFSHLDITFLPLLNAVMNSFTFIFLLSALIMIKQKNIKAHRRFIFAAFSTTLVFLISYVTYHSMAADTHFGEKESFVRFTSLFSSHISSYLPSLYRLH